MGWPRNPLLRARAGGVAVLLAVLTACIAATSPPATPRPSSPVQSSSSQRRPNIVFVLTDDLATNLVRYMPHVRALQRRGTTFTDYIATDSLCCPSRASIFTGRYPHDTHVITNHLPLGGFRKFYREGLQKQTFAEMLSRVGYRTGFMGKYLNRYNPNWGFEGQLPYVPPGWSAWDASGDYGYFGFNYTIADNHTYGWYGHTRRGYLTSVLNRRAQAFIRSSGRRRTPFLLEVATYTPHKPYVPAPEDVGTFANVRAPRSPAFDTRPTHPPVWLRRQTHAFTQSQRNEIDHAFQLRVEDVQSIDRMIGDLEATLRRTHQAANTYFVFTSDNGYHMGEHQLMPGKMTAYDTDIRVPLVVTGPRVRAGVSVPAMVENTDLAPTFEDIANAPVPQQTDGSSMLPLLTGTTTWRRWRQVALIEHHGPDNDPNEPDYPPPGSGNPPSYDAIRSRDYLFVQYAGGGREYYNLRTDPLELHNVAGRLSPQHLQRLRTELAAMTHCHDAAQCSRAAGAGTR